MKQLHSKHYDDFDKSYGRKAAIFRKQVLGLTQTKLANEIGVTRSAIAKFEAGEMHSAFISATLIDMGFSYYD